MTLALALAVLVWLPYRQVWAVDFEFRAPPGERPEPICIVARELRSGETRRLWGDDLRRQGRPPYPVDASSVLLAYYAPAELGCHLALGWDLPENVIDLFVEFRHVTNGRPLPCGAGLLGALAYHGLPGTSSTDKERMRALAMRGGPYSEVERADLLAYCETDVDALEQLAPHLLRAETLAYALLRGRFMKAVAHMEHAGVPIDAAALAALRAHWPAIQSGLIAEVDPCGDIYEAGSFSAARYSRWLDNRGISWPRLPSGALALDDDTFKDLARVHPEIEPVRQVRQSLSQMRLADLAVGADSRNRTGLSAFRSLTGRNQPSNSRFIFGASAWLRSLIKPRQGFGLAYVDYEQQEFGIAAALSGDPTMRRAYETGDAYLAFALQAGAVPPRATKESHALTREQFKATALGVQYGMAAASLAVRLGSTVARARELLELHHRTYPVFWRWSDSAVDRALLLGSLHTVFDWRVHTGPDPNPRSLRNFPMQANGAEMLRLACCFLVEDGIHVCAPVHDALLIEAPLEVLDDTIIQTRHRMAEASQIVLAGFPLRTEVKEVRSPDRYFDKRGSRMWNAVWRIIGEIDPGAAEAVHRCSGDAAPVPPRAISSASPAA